MKILSLLVALALVPSLVFAADWTTAYEKLKDSVVYVETSQGSCTAFVINEEKNLVLTAAHCYDEIGKVYVDQRPASKVVYRDTKKDLMVLEVPDLNKPAVALAKNDPKVGDEIASYGYGYGLEQPFFKTHHTMGANIHINSDGYGGPYVGVDTAFNPGMSGGPVVNPLGELVAVVQFGNPSVGFGVGAETIRDKVGRYFAYK